MSKEVKYCSRCGHMLSTDQSKCPQCGFDFNAKSVDPVNPSDKTVDTGKSPSQPAVTTLDSSNDVSLNYQVKEVKTPFCGLGDAFIKFFKNYANFTDKSNRSEFWFAQIWWWLITGFLTSSFVYMVIHAHPTTVVYSPFGIYSMVPESSPASSLFAWVLIIWLLATIVPQVALIMRRLRDVSISTFWIVVLFLCSAIPGIASIAGLIILVITMLPSYVRVNK